LSATRIGFTFSSVHADSGKNVAEAGVSVALEKRADSIGSGAQQAIPKKPYTTFLRYPSGFE